MNNDFTLFCFAQAAAAAECRIQLLAICFAEWNWTCEPCSTMTPWYVFVFLSESRKQKNITVHDFIIFIFAYLYNKQ